MTALSLIAGFSVLLLSEFVSVRHFGELIAVTVLNCLVGALLIQPALLLLVYRQAARRSPA
jgi:predicted RND superfamily exporter protein